MHYGLLLLRNTRQYFSTILEDHFKQRNHQKKHNNAKYRALNRLKSILVQQYDVKTRRQSVALFGLYWACAHGATQVFGHSVHVCSDHKSSVTIDLGLQINCSKSVNSQIQNRQIVRTDYI